MHPLEFIKQNAQTFARNGAVVATYRTRGTNKAGCANQRTADNGTPNGQTVESAGIKKRYGPYYRVAYRVAGRQCSIYLGRCKKLADQVRGLLAKLQHPRDYRRLCKRANRQRRATLRRVIRHWQLTMRAYGLDFRGCELRGWRRLGIPRIDKTTPFNAVQRTAAAMLLTPPIWFTPHPTADPRYWQNATPVDQQRPKANSPHAPP